MQRDTHRTVHTGTEREHLSVQEAQGGVAGCLIKGQGQHGMGSLDTVVIYTERTSF